MMFDSFALYAGAAAVGGGAIAMLSRRHRSRGAIVAAGGLIAMIVSLAWPVSERRIVTKSSRLDDIMPVWQFDESHTIHVNASPERVFDAIHNVTADDIAFFHTLTAVRRFGRSERESILNAPGHEPILAVATRTSFRYLADDPPHELVLGTRISPSTVAVMNFAVASDGHGGSNVSTETRVHSTTDRARREFAVYWRIIHPGSDIIRRMWLRAIRKRAEHVL
jgi:hypothetical protein